MQDPLESSVETALTESAVEAPTASPTGQSASLASVGPPGFEIIELLGQGGMGVVHRARHLGLNRMVALKSLRNDHAKNEGLISRFNREARITACLQHPGIPPLYEMGTLADERPFFAMKLILGSSLDDLLREQGAGAERWLGVFESICQAMAYAHSLGIIHRDLKLANVMVGEFGVVYVMDWGLAKELLGESREVIDPLAANALTCEGSVMGTIAYMPPEQAAGEIALLDRRSDVYSLGAILCALLTGRPPSLDAFARLDQSGAEPALVALAKQCLASNQKERPADAGEVARAIAQLRRQAEERARLAENEQIRLKVEATERAKQAELERTHAEEQAKARQQRRRLRLVAMLTVFVVLSAGIVGTTFGLFQAVNARQEEANQRQRAETASETAQNRYQLALDALNDMVFGIQDKLKTRPATQELRKELLSKARAGLEKLLSETESQGQPDRTLVWARYRMGDVEEALGNSQSAKVEYEAGFELARQLAEANPDRAETQRDLSAGLIKLGDWLKKNGKSAEALKLYEQSLVIRQQLANAYPNNSEAQRDLALNLNKLGDFVLREEPEKALGYYRESFDIRQRLSKVAPRDREIQRDIGVCLEKLGNAMRQLGKRNEALEYHTSCLKSRQELYDSDPANVQYQRDLCVCLELLGDIADKQGKIDDATQYYSRSLRICLRGVDLDPNNPQARSDLAGSYDRVGELAMGRKKVSEALDAYTKSFQFRQELAKANPTDLQVQLDLFRSCYNIGVAERTARNHHTAGTWFAKGRIVLLPWHEKKQLPEKFAKAVAHMDEEIEECRTELAIVNLGFLFEQETNQIPKLLSIRVRALLQRKHIDPAIRTAEAWARWTETQPYSGDLVYNSSCSLALCAAAHPARRDLLVSKTIGVLTRLRERGYFTAEQVAQLRRDEDFDGIREHPAFAKFVESLKGK